MNIPNNYSSPLNGIAIGSMNNNNDDDDVIEEIMVMARSFQQAQVRFVMVRGRMYNLRRRGVF